MVFDGDCGFCRYWLVKWRKLSQDHYDYQPYQSAAARFKDIPLKDFQQAVHLIFPDGKVLRGASVAYYPYYQFGSADFLYNWYRKGKLFSRLSDLAYQWVASNRNFFFKLTKLLFGNDPYQNGLAILFSRLLMLLLIILATVYLANI